MQKANRKFVQHKIDFINKCYDTVSAVSYSGEGHIEIVGQGLREEPYRAFLGNAQLAGNLARAIAEDYQIKEIGRL
jgi:hypothetical protein